ncbi:hypothetical protein HYPSUDRAFT_54802 [Hypholoma sublateritium FD-334 SS-4]|uniref:Ubiquitin carboxyl-terminal hydrolase n=1 Tax=Hypholoma sublateritium (strain FD-334 SS-4) TaxID=945553 RepID=A0A0D2PSJ7_HYPSF|nr:hypothetical protein HYPSUDRAFT_54802 [Hypholoma sublateritium FD-334 SS-4]
MAKKIFGILENNPDVMNPLAARLGLSPALAFHDIYSLTEPDLLALVPRPAHALLVTIPMTPAWRRAREEEDAGKGDYEDVGDDPVLWFQQTIEHACGSIGLLHCVLNGTPAAHILPDSELARIRKDALPKTMVPRARVLEESEFYEAAHRDAAQQGQSDVPPVEHNHFVAFVKGTDGHLWELEGSRKGPLDRCILAENEDMLSEKALNAGLRRVMEIEKNDEGGDLLFSCIVLAPAT